MRRQIRHPLTFGHPIVALIRLAAAHARRMAREALTIPVAQRRAHAAPAGDGRQPDMSAAAALFVQALHEDSNLELDWLWLAAQLPNGMERRYCLQRARAINPHSDLALPNDERIVQ